MLTDWINDYLASLVALVKKPESRLYWGCMLSALLFFIIALPRKKLTQAILETVSHLKLWLHPSSRLDLKLIMANQVFRLFMIKPLSILLIAGFAALVSTIASYLLNAFGAGQNGVIWTSDSSLPKSLIMLLYSLSLFVVNDFARFYLHRLQHKNAYLWCFHRVHHSASVLTPFTLLRSHPVDILCASFRDMLSLGTVNGIAYASLGGELSAIEILGVNAFGFVFNAFGANLRHSHAFISFGPLEHIFISPAAHQIHHSQDPKHHDKNFGVCLSIWDKLGGSHLPAAKTLIKDAPLRFGLALSKLSDPSHQRLGLMYSEPFKALLKILKNHSSA